MESRAVFLQRPEYVPRSERKTTGFSHWVDQKTLSQFWGYLKILSGGKHLCSVLAKEPRFFSRGGRALPKFRWICKDPSDPFSNYTFYGLGSIIKRLKKCIRNPDKRMTAIFIHLTCGDSRHSNVLLYDHKYKTLDRFEPNSIDLDFESRAEQWNQDLLDKAIQEYFKKNKVEISEYRNNYQLCPLISFQAKFGKRKGEILTRYIGPHSIQVWGATEKIGFCSAWTLWYLNERVKHPDKNPKTLVKDFLEEFKWSPDKLNQFIIDWTNEIVDFRNDTLLAVFEAETDVDPEILDTEDPEWWSLLVEQIQQEKDLEYEEALDYVDTQLDIAISNLLE